MQPATKLIEYRGYKILWAEGLYWFMGLSFKTWLKVTEAVDNHINNQT